MVKLGLEIKDYGDVVNINLVDPTKKQLNEATENEKVIAQKIKDSFEDIIELLENKEN